MLCEVYLNLKMLLRKRWDSQVAHWYRIHLKIRRRAFDPWVGKIPWKMKWQPTPVFLPGKFHGQRSLAGPWGHKDLDMTEHMHTHHGVQANKYKVLAVVHGN